MNNELITKQADSCSGHPPVDLFGECWAEMTRNGTTDRFTFPFSAYYKAVWVEKEGKCVGFILYRTDMENEWWVCCSYTTPEWRCRGIYRHLMEDLAKRAREAKILRISGGTFTENKVMQAGYAATGRTKKSETWVLEL
jgi:GNAT superfamily N-acetyltransferase